MQTIRRLLPVILAFVLPVLAALVLGLRPDAAPVRSINLTPGPPVSDMPGEDITRLKTLAVFEPWRPGLWEKIGRQAFESQAWAEAIEAFRRAEDQNQLSKEGRVLLGEAFLRAGSPQTALRIWKAVLDARPSGPDDYKRVASLQRSLGDLPGAAETLQMQLLAGAGGVSQRWNLGLILLLDHPDEALQELLQAAGEDHAYLSASQTLRTAINTASLEQDASYRLVLLGRALGSAGAWDLAQIAFERAVQTAPDYGEAWAFLGEAKHQNGVDGRSELEKAARLSPDSVLVLALNAITWRREGKYDEALTALQRAVRLEPQQPAWLIEIAVTLAERGKLEDAVVYYSKAVDMDAKNPVRWMDLARFCVQYSVQVRTVGLPAARQAVILSPDDPAALDVMGLVLFNTNDLTSAERFLQRAVEKNKTYAPAYLHLGQIYLQGEKYEQALNYLSQASTLAAPDDATGRIARRLLDIYFPGG